MKNEFNIILPPIISVFFKTIPNEKRDILVQIVGSGSEYKNSLSQPTLFSELAQNAKLDDKFLWSPKPVNLRYYSVLSLDFVDQHDGIIPDDLLPPNNIFRSFSNKILSSPRPLQLFEQFSLAIKETENDTVSASFLCQVVNRFYGRGLDQRLYPEVPINLELMSKWKNNLAGFNFNVRDGRLPDTVACTYYFFTGLTSSLLLNQKSHKHDFAIKTLFEYAPRLMNFARSNCANQPSLGDYDQVYAMGWEIGKVIANDLSS